MTIDEIRALKDEAEKEIAATLARFSEATGLPVDFVAVDVPLEYRLDRSTPSPASYRVEISVSVF